MKYTGEFVETVRSMPREDVENLVFFLLGAVSIEAGHMNETAEELLDWCLVCIGYKE